MNDKEKPFSLRDRLTSFRYAFSGLAHLVLKEHNFRIHLAAALLAIAAGLLLEISAAEWLLITIAIALVLITETFNSSIERLCDIVSPGEDVRIKKIKDTLAAAVLISALMAVVIGAVIFLPHIFRLF